MHRNNIIFRNGKANPQEILKIAKMETTRWQRGFGENGKTTSKNSHEAIREKEPMSWKWGTLQQCDNILRVDGAWKKVDDSRSRAAYGWVMEQKGNRYKEESSRIFATSPLHAEAHALLAGAKSAIERWRTVTIYTDSEKIIQLLHNPRNAQYVYKTSRENVKRAHNLATEARKVP
ncbi:Transient receptor potential cation channel subfamily M member 5 [Bienertia sinuspersici]